MGVGLLITTWVLVLWIAPSGMTSIGGFESEADCAEAGDRFVAEREHWWSRNRAWWCIPVSESGP